MPSISSSALTTIVMYSPLPLKTVAFANKVYRNATLYVPKGSLERYQAAEAWKDFWTIKEFDSTQEVVVSLNHSKAKLGVGGMLNLIATVTPEDIPFNTVTWTSSDTDVATVDNNGVVTAVAEGTVTISAIVGDKSATCIVTVGDLSGINQLRIDDSQSIIYDLQGRRVLNTENLKSGLYIINGKKTVIK